MTLAALAAMSLPVLATPLSDEVARAVDARLAGAATPASSMPIFTTRDDATATYVRNPQCWAATLDLTPLSVWNDYGGPTLAGTLVAPRVVVSAQHFQVADDSRLRWVTRGNVVVERKVIASARVGQTDIHVSLLNAAVPAEISFARILPAGYEAKLPLAGLPLVRTDQEKKALVGDAVGAANGLISFKAPPDATRANFYEQWITGDSGSAGLLFVRGQPVLLIAAFGAFDGPDYSANAGDLQAAIASLGTNERLTFATLADPPPTQQSGAVVIRPK